MNLEPSPYDDEFELCVGLDRDRGRVQIVYTEGLEKHGLAELSIEPPEWFVPDPEVVDQGWFAVFLAQALRELAVAAFEADGAEILPLATSLEGTPVVFWLLDGPPQGTVTSRLHEERAEMQEIGCSLWSADVPAEAGPDFLIAERAR